MLRWHIQTNAWLCLVNYPVTMAVQSVTKSEPMFYILEIFSLLLLKVDLFIATNHHFRS